MPYGKSEIKNSNIDYTGRDFNDLKSTLIRYVKSYFPNTYQDFNETSPGMMLIEMSAYVGDVLNFYVDQQYREMLLPLSEDRRNLITLAKSQGYTPKTVAAAYVTLTINDIVGADSDGKADYSSAVIIDKGMKVSPSSDTTLLFETLDVVDFKISSSANIPDVQNEINSATGVPSSYKLTRRVSAIGGETKTTSFKIGEPTKFLSLKLPELNVIEILKVVDDNDNIWYEVGSLAQDKIPSETHYTSTQNRTTAYTTTDGSSTINLPVPYSLEYIKTGKRFIVDIDENNNTSLIFGNGILKNGNTFDASFLAIEQQGINLPGGEEDLESEIDPLLGDAYGTLGQSPSHTTLTITYRIGGGAKYNISSGILTNIVDSSLLAGSNVNISVTNENPAGGGSSGETIDEIRHKTLGNFSTQARCVTKSDFESRTMNMSAKFGSIAKVYCGRSGAIMNAQRKKVKDLVTSLTDIIDTNYEMLSSATTGPDSISKGLEKIKRLLDVDKSGGLNTEDIDLLSETLELTYSNVSQDDRLYTVDLYLLSYNNNKDLISTPTIIKQNLKQYLNQYRMITDQISFYDGHVINFGVVFDVIAQQYESKDDVKFRCIQAIKNYFSADKMQFKQILYTSDLNQLLVDVDGVRAVNYTTITQDYDYNAQVAAGGSQDFIFSPQLYTTLIQSDGSTKTTNNSGYGYYYDFGKFYGTDAIAGNGVILPSYEPAVFELKNPNKNIKGIVR